jgi:hypothetical protein
MKTIHASRALFILVMVMLPMMSATSAYAGGFTHHQIVTPVDWFYTWPADENPCGFDLIFHQYGNLRINYWTDEKGWWVREIDIYGNLAMTQSAGDKSLNILVKGPAHYEFAFPSENILVLRTVSNGPDALTPAPGQGIVGGGVGHIIYTSTYDITDPDNWILLSDHLDFAVGNLKFDSIEFCDYLRP